MFHGDLPGHNKIHDTQTTVCNRDMISSRTFYLWDIYFFSVFGKGKNKTLFFFGKIMS
jgi:hypothetical protein